MVTLPLAGFSSRGHSMSGGGGIERERAMRGLERPRKGDEGGRKRMGKGTRRRRKRDELMEAGRQGGRMRRMRIR